MVAFCAVALVCFAAGLWAFANMILDSAAADERRRAGNGGDDDR